MHQFSKTNIQPLLSNTSSSNNDQRKNTHDSLKKDLMSQLSNIILRLQQLCGALSMYDQENFLAAMSASQPIDALPRIMKGTEEKVNIKTDNTNNLTWQQLLNYLGNKIYLISINYMQNIEELINNNTMDANESENIVITQTSVCCEKIWRITSNLQEYLASISTDNSYTDTQRYLAEKINENAYLTSSIKNLADEIKDLQQIQKDYNNKNINNIKKDNNNSVPNESFIKFREALNNIAQSENSKNIK